MRGVAIFQSAASQPIKRTFFASLLPTSGSASQTLSIGLRLRTLLPPKGQAGRADRQEPEGAGLGRSSGRPEMLNRGLTSSGINPIVRATRKNGITRAAVGRNV